MLSDRERQTLHELESQFQDEKTARPGSFVSHTRGVRDRVIAALGWAAFVPMVILLALVLLVSGAVGLVLGLAGGAALLWVCWLSITKSSQMSGDDGQDRR